MDLQSNPVFNITYYEEPTLEKNGVDVGTREGHFFSRSKNAAGDSTPPWYYMTPKPKDVGPAHPLIKCSACKHVFFPDKFFRHACGHTFVAEPPPPPVRGVIASGVVLHKNTLSKIPVIGTPLYLDDPDNDDTKLTLKKNDPNNCVGIYAGEGPMIKNTVGALDRTLLVHLQQ